MKNSFVFFKAILFLSLFSVPAFSDERFADSDGEVSADVACPQAIITANMTDSTSNLWRSTFKKPTPNQKCSPPTKKNMTAAQMENEIIKNPEFADVSQRGLRVTKPTCMGDARKSLSRGLEKFSEDEKKKMVGEYYMVMKKVNDSSKLTIESMAAIDSLIPPETNYSPSKNFLHGADCRGNMKSWCDKLKDCKSDNESQRQKRYDAMVNQTKEILSSINNIKNGPLKETEAEIRRQYPKGFYIAKGQPVPPIIQKRKDIEGAISFMESTVPWIKGKEFSRVYKGDPSNWKNLTGAFNEQLKSNRKALVDQMRQLSATRACINDASKQDCPESGGILAAIPDLKVADDKTGISSYVTNAQCRMATRRDNDTFDELGETLFQTTALTVATFGLGSIAAGTRLAMAAGESLEITAAGSRAAVLAEQAALRAGSSSTASALGLNTGRMAFMGSIGLDAATSATSLNHAKNICFSNGALSEIPSASGRTLQTPSCAINNTQQNVMADAQSCTAAVIMEGIPSLIPFIPAGLKAGQLMQIARADKAVYQAFNTSLNKAGGNMDEVMHALALGNVSETNLPRLIKALDSDEKVANFKKELEAIVKGGTCKVGL